MGSWPVGSWPVGSWPVGCLKTGARPSDGAQASAGVVHAPGAAQARLAKLTSCSRMLAPPVRWSASMATKQRRSRQSAAPSAVVRTAGSAIVTEAVPAEPTVMTALCRLSQASWTEAPGSASKAIAVGSHSATA